VKKTTKRTTRGMRYIGLDIGDRFSHYAVRNSVGAILEEKRLPSTEVALRKSFTPFKGNRLLMEVGTHSPWMQRVLRELGIDARVCEARSAAEANRYGRKTDVRDARLLSELLRTDSHLVRLVEHRSTEDQATWAVIQSRDALVRSRTALVNQARGICKSWGRRLPGCTTSAFNAQTWFHVPEELRPALSPLYEQILETTERINEYDKKIAACIQETHPEVERLTEIHGVGNLTALAFVLAVGNVKRFQRSRDIGAYFGLVPKKRASGDVDPQLGISKRGNETVRRLLVGAAHYILGPFNKTESDLRTFGVRIQGGGTDSRRKRRAVVAVARKLAVVMGALLINEQPYRAVRKKTKRVSA
jgi:transposase